jgi:hypothetical protein
VRVNNAPHLGVGINSFSIADYCMIGRVASYVTTPPSF